MNKTVLIVLIVVGAICVICGGGAAISWFAFRGVIEGPMQCGMTLGTAQNAFEKYAGENGKMPDAENWQLALAPFMKAEGVEVMGMKVPAADEVWLCNPSDPQTGIAFNSDLSGVDWEDVPRDTVILFETPETGMNLSAPYKALPTDQSPKIAGNPRGWFVMTKSGVESATNATR